MGHDKDARALTPIDASKIATPDELFAYLNQLSAIDSGSMGSLVLAHTEALQLVQSPQTVNTAIARALNHVVQAMSLAGSAQERQQVQRAGIHLINNFVAYIDAKYQADIQNNRAEAERIFQGFAQEALAGITTVAATVAGGAGLQIANFTQQAGLVSRFVSLGLQFFSNRRNQAERTEEFIRSVAGVIDTVDLYSPQLGASNIVASLVNSYSPLIVQHDESTSDKEIRKKTNRATRARRRLVVSVVVTAILAFLGRVFTGVVGFVSNMVVAILRLLRLIGPDVSDKATGLPGTWFMWVAFIVNGYMLARWLWLAREWRDERNQQHLRTTQLRAEFKQIADRFRE